MADRMLFISWEAPIPGREEHGLEVFNEAVGLYGRMQQEGRIESFDIGMMVPNATLDGYIALRGTAEQIAAVRDDESYLRSITDAGLCVTGLCVTEGFCGDGVTRVMGMYQEAAARVPQMA
jgi:hypothetical protein